MAIATATAAPTVASQSRMGSLVEALINVVIGFSINYVANLLVFPLFGLHISLAANFWLGVIYTAISIARSYVIRRWFNARLHTLALRLAGAGAEVAETSDDDPRAGPDTYPPRPGPER